MSTIHKRKEQLKWFTAFDKITIRLTALIELRCSLNVELHRNRVKISICSFRIAFISLRDMNFSNHRYFPSMTFKIEISLNWREVDHGFIFQCRLICSHPMTASVVPTYSTHLMLRPCSVHSFPLTEAPQLASRRLSIDISPKFFGYSEIDQRVSYEFQPARHVGPEKIHFIQTAALDRDKFVSQPTCTTATCQNAMCVFKISQNVNVNSKTKIKGRRKREKKHSQEKCVVFRVWQLFKSNNNCERLPFDVLKSVLLPTSFRRAILKIAIGTIFCWSIRRDRKSIQMKHVPTLISR